MEISPVLQTELLFRCGLLGLAAGTVWELCAALEEQFYGKKTLYKILQFVFDFLIIAVFGFLVMIMCYYFNKGEVRFFAFAGFFAGFFAFKLTLGKWAKCLFCAILRILGSFICALLKPVVKIFKYSVNNLQKIIYFIRKVLEKIAGLVYNIYITKSILKKAENCFFDKRSR